MVAEVRPDYPSERSAMKAVATKPGVKHAETVRQLGAPGRGRHRCPATTEESVELKRLKRENAELRRGERDPESSGGFLRGRARPATQVLIAFIDAFRKVFGVEPICRVLSEHGTKIAPSTYYAARSRPASARAVRDEWLKTEITRIFEANYRVYGARKIWRQLQREGHDVARCTVERLMREPGLHGARRSRRVRTTVRDDGYERATDLLRRDPTATSPNRRWVADFTHVSTWAGVVYVAFVVDIFSRAVVGWTASTSKRTRLVLDALDMALW
ncbi:IS3 family transposase [Spirillospora sp. NPDC048819]|uniref:IS3 family transposase n=1 Tax=Spirillospora sp. NPDC048819 TaxID=3155268 RepID=UPI0033F99CEF